MCMGTLVHDEQPFRERVAKPVRERVASEAYQLREDIARSHILPLLRSNLLRLRRLTGGSFQCLRAHVFRCARVVAVVRCIPIHFYSTDVDSCGAARDGGAARRECLLVVYQCTHGVGPGVYPPVGSSNAL